MNKTAAGIACLGSYLQSSLWFIYVQFIAWRSPDAFMFEQNYMYIKFCNI